MNPFLYFANIYSRLARLKNCLILLFLVLCVPSYGQVLITSSDSVGCNNPCTTLTATLSGDMPTDAGITVDDVYSVAHNIGFTFNFYGTNYTQLLIGPNGTLCFNTALASSVTNFVVGAALLGNATVKNSICGPWCDMDVNFGGTITYSLTGTAPFRKYSVTFCAVHMYSCTNQATTSQIILYETTNIVEVHVTAKPICAGWNGGHAIIGVENAAGTAATAAPGRDFPSVYTCTNEAWRFTPNIAYTNYTVSAIAYAPIPYITSSLYWFNATTNTYLGTGASIVVCPTTTTTYKAGALGCADTSFGFYTVVPTPPVGNITGQQSVCTGSSTTLVDATAGGVWNSSNGSIATVSPGGVVTGISPGTVTITYTALGCNVTFSFTVNPKPTPPVATSPTYCQGAVAVPLSAAGTNLVWYGPGVTGGMAVAPTPSTTTPGTTIYFVTQTTALGCVSDSATDFVTVNPKPLSPVALHQTYCQNSAAVPVSATGTNLLWYGPGVTAGMAAAPTPSTATAGSITYYVTQSNAFGCTSDSAVDVVTVTPVSPITGSPSICLGFATTLTNANAGGTWTSNDPTIASIGLSTGQATGLATGNTTITYTFLGCTTTFPFTVNIIPAPPVVLPQTYCQNDVPVPVSATGSNLLWYGPGVTAGATTAPTPSTTAAGTTTYYVTQTTGPGCVSDSSTDIVTVNPMTPVSGISTVCFPDTATLFDATPGGTWSSSNSSIASIDPLTGFVTSGAGGGTVTITYLLAGCTALYNYTVNPKPAPPVVTPQTYCQNDAAAPLSATGTNLMWYGPGVTGSMATAPTPATTAGGTTTYYVTQTSAFGCVSDSAIDNIIVNPMTPILGMPSICETDTTTLADATAGGAWSSSNSSIASIDPLTGLITGTSGGIVTVTYSLSGCSATYNFTVNPKPAPPVVTPQAYCQFVTALPVSATGTNLLWYGPGTTAAQVIAPTPATATVGVTNYYVTQTSAFGCLSDSALEAVTVNAKPVAPVITPQTYCQNTVAVPVIATGTNLTWYGPGITPGTAIAPTPSTAVSGTVTYFVTQTSGAGCISDSSTDVVTINPVSPITGPLNVCFGFTASENNANPGGTWSSSNPGIASIDPSTGFVTGISAGTVTFTYLLSGCPATSSFTVNPKPAPPVVLPQTFCQNDIAVPVSATGTNLIWYVPGITPGTTIAPTPSTLVAGTVTYYVTQTSAFGCVSDSSIDVVTINPVAPVTGPSSICFGFTASMSNANPGGTWSSSGPGVASIDPNTGFVTSVSAGTINLTYLLSGCPSNYLFTVNPKPTPPVVVPQTYCQFVTALPVAAAGTNLLWYGPGVTAGMSFAPVPSTNTPGNITYYVTQTSAFGCVSDSSIDVVAVIPKPAAPTTWDTNYCQYAPYLVPLVQQVNSAAGSTLNWYDNAGATLPGAPFLSSAVWNYPAGTTWQVSQTVNGCESDKTPVNVMIVPTPDFTVVNNHVMCNDDSEHISYTLAAGSAVVAEVYTWSFPAHSYLISGTDTGAAVTIMFDSSYTMYNTGTLTIGNFGGRCSRTDTFSIKVETRPVTDGYCKEEICLGDTISIALRSHTNDAYIYTWLVDGVPMASSPALDIISANVSSGGPFVVSWGTPGVHIISLTASTYDGCSSKPQYDTVRVHALPDATFTTSQQGSGAPCIEDSVLFSAHSTDQNFAYLWQPTHFFNNDNKPVIWGRPDKDVQNTVVTLTVTDPFGCKATNALDINTDACCIVSFPTAFTPNGDGHNDYYRPIFAGYHKFHVFRITNRYGQTVFESADTYPQWDGTFNGVKQDMDVFYYYLRYDCGGATIEKKGDLTLIR